MDFRRHAGDAVFATLFPDFRSEEDDADGGVRAAPAPSPRDSPLPNAADVDVDAVWRTLTASRQTAVAAGSFGPGHMPAHSQQSLKSPCSPNNTSRLMLRAAVAGDRDPFGHQNSAGPKRPPLLKWTSVENAEEEIDDYDASSIRNLLEGTLFPDDAEDRQYEVCARAAYHPASLKNRSTIFRRPCPSGIVSPLESFLSRTCSGRSRRSTWPAR